MTEWYPLHLRPTLHTRVWGGRRLADELGKHLPTDDPYGESWELHDSATVTNGPFAGQTLGDLLKHDSAGLIGTYFDPSEGFPLLAKLLDADDWLSVQVHPDDAQARALEGQPRGKTEAWVLLAAQPGARLVIGVKPGVSRVQMADAIRANTLEDHLLYAKVQRGDVLYMPAGTIHAIGPGTLIYEIQQSSDTTYRLYDWGRVGLDGKPRQLHIEKGVQVANVEQTPVITRAQASDAAPIIAGEYFLTYWHRLNSGTMTLDTTRREFHALTCIAGSAKIKGGGQSVGLAKGETALIPAGLGVYHLSGRCEVLRSLPVIPADER